ncbi:MAG: GNAT family N-acetyltransferase [Gammaproteobacteria bacterium]|nr:GNAT family N-acetyltransferase [Gammaproteobacteria bacterium]
MGLKAGQLNPRAEVRANGETRVNSVRLIRAQSAENWEQAKVLVNEYADSLEFDLDFQDFETEIEVLHKEYGPPAGCFLLAVQDANTVGCVALRRLDRQSCEMKRLYVRSQHRGRGTGHLLAQAIIEVARELGYKRMRLDTVPSMQSAQALYTSLGFGPIDPYRYNPIPGTQFMELEL